VARVCYLDDIDTLIVADEGREDMRHIGRVFICKGYLAAIAKRFFRAACRQGSGMRSSDWDYAFTGGWKERVGSGSTALSDGAEVGVFDPGPTVGGVENTGWIDILTGITAFRRANGEYVVVCGGRL